MKLNYSVITLFVIALAISLHYIYLVTFSVNAPNGDDYYCIYDFLYQYQNTSGFTNKFNLFITPWLEHSIGYTKFLTLLIYKIWGELNFRTYILLGNLSLVGIAFIMYKTYQKLKFPIWYLIPGMLLLFQPQSHEGLFWPGATACYMSVLCFSFASVYLVVQNGRKSLAGSAFFALVAIYTFGAGIFVLPVNALVLLLKRDYRRLVLWCVTAIAIFIVFKTFYVYPDAERPPILYNLLHHPNLVIQYFLAFLGMLFDFDERTRTLTEALPIIAAGSVILLTVIVCILLLLKKIWNESSNQYREGLLSLVGFTTLILLGGASLALLRGHNEIIYIFAGRYKIYDALLWGFLFVGLVASVAPTVASQKIFVRVSLSLAVLFFGFSYFNYTYKIKYTRDDFLSGMFNWHQNQEWLIYRKSSYFEKTSNHLSKTMGEKSSPYHIPKAFEDLTNEKIAASTQKSDLQFGSIIGESIFISSETSPRTNLTGGQFVFLKSPDKLYLFPVESKPNSRRKFITERSWYKDGYYGTIYLKDLPAETYITGDYNSKTGDVAISSQKIKISENAEATVF